MSGHARSSRRPVGTVNDRPWQKRRRRQAGPHRAPGQVYARLAYWGRGRSCRKKVGPVNLAANSSKGLRASTRIANGTRVALQNGRFQLIGRWRSGPVGFNLSKTGVSASVKNKAGTFNFLKPQYSSFKLAGIQLRGRKAAELQMIYMLFMTVVFAVIFGVKLFVFLAWLLSLPVLFIWDLIVGFVQGVRSS